MATRIADTLGRMGSGDYPLVYAKDIEFEDGQDLQSFIDKKQDKMQMTELPALREEINGRVYQYVGNTTSRFTNCHFYKAHCVGLDRYWEEVDVVDVPKDVSDLTDTTGVIPKDVFDLTDENKIIPKDVADLSDKSGLIPTDVSELKDESGVIPSDIEDLSDVNVSEVSNGQVLGWDETTQKWKNIDQTGRHGIVNPTSGFAPDRGYLMFGEGFNVSDDENANQTVIEQYELTNEDIAEIMAVLN